MLLFATQLRQVLRSYTNKSFPSSSFSCLLMKVRESEVYAKHIPAGIYLLKVNNRNTRTKCEICSKLTIKTSERRHWRRPGVFIVNFEHISQLVLVFLLLTLNK